MMVSCHVIKKFGTELRPKSSWPSLDSSWQCYYLLGTTTKIVNALSLHLFILQLQTSVKTMQR